MSNKYNIIQKIASNRRFTPVLCIVLFSFILCLGGCTTTKIENVNESQLPSRTDYEILSVVMKNGEKISLKNNNPGFEIIYKGIPNVILYMNKDTTILTDNMKKISSEERVIELKNIKSVKIEMTRVQVAKTIIVVTGLVLILSVEIGLGIALKGF
ncbi:MAG: hypothetical protein ABSF32_00695 [Ignavibacteria bacterium]|jgi:hypothetical protein